MNFEWDSEKDRLNRRLHGVSFDEAKEVFTGGADYLEIYDGEHSQDEDRFIAIGPVQRGLVLVAFTERQEGTIRIISARWATASESRLFRRYLGVKE